MRERMLRLATGIGSLPCKTPAQALELIFKHVPLLPHWPQLPAAGKAEGMIRQYLSPLADSGLVAEREDMNPYFATEEEGWEERLANFDRLLASPTEETVSAFAFPPEAAAGFYAFLDHLSHKGCGPARLLKGQLTGPLTMGIMVTDGKLQPAFYHHRLRGILTGSLAMHLRWQARELKQFNLPVLLFLDEPGLYACGKAGHAARLRDNLTKCYELLLQTAQAEGILLGIHACAGVDFGLLFSLPFAVVNIDTYNYFKALLPYSQELNNYLQRGGVVAFGLVPTSAQVEQETAAGLLARLQEQMEQLAARGVDLNRLRRQVLFTPSCGAGTLTERQASLIYRLLQQVAENYLP
ncbi:MAG TPA: hypothetical protein GX699_08390 [Firmicutes bacterium]|jgi:hypothetical protein|nr:hypothetical protein [Bacillota bacterium]